KANNAFGPTHKIVEDTATQLDDADAGKGFVLKLGVKLVKSKKPTALAGRNGAFYAFEIPAGQAGKWISEFGMVMTTTAAQDEVVEPAPLANLTNLKIDDAAAFPGSSKI